MKPALLLLSLPVVAACGGDACEIDETYDPAIDPAQFTTTIDNPLWPLVPGTTTVFEGGGETVTVVVTSDTYQVADGITARVVRDTVTVDGEITEDTYDWYAQDADGNVWYVGEDTKEFDAGQVESTEGSWEAGVDGAKPGIVMYAVQPEPGVVYRQEYYPCEAEDEAEVVDTSVSVTVPYGSFTGCLKTHEFTPLEPDVDAYKYYCPGIGVVLEEEGGTRVELISVTPPA